MVYGSGEKGELVLYFFTINIFKKLKRPNILESREVHKTRIKYGYGEQQWYNLYVFVLESGTHTNRSVNFFDFKFIYYKIKFINFS